MPDPLDVGRRGALCLRGDPLPLCSLCLCRKVLLALSKAFATASFTPLTHLTELIMERRSQLLGR